jgi:molybdopterin-biosynthesis enzyme MoeA-like protein
MATLPTGATPLANEVGTAPGVRIHQGPTVIFCLPGVPLEMKHIFSSSIEQEVRGKVGKLYRKAIRLKFEGIFESDLAPLIRREMDQHPGVYIKSHPRGLRDGISRIELDIVAVKQRKEESLKAAESIAGDLIQKVKERGAIIKYTSGMPTNRTG